MICLDNNALIALCQTNPQPSSVTHRDRLRAFVRDRLGERIMVPAIVLAEYLFPFADADHQTEFDAVLKASVHIAEFNLITAEVSANLGRRFAAGRSLGQVARDLGTDRVVLKADLLIVATAVQHNVDAFVTADKAAHELAKFAGLNAFRLDELPEPKPFPLPTEEKASVQRSLIDYFEADSPSGPC